MELKLTSVTLELKIHPCQLRKGRLSSQWLRVMEQLRDRVQPLSASPVLSPHRV